MSSKPSRVEFIKERLGMNTILYKHKNYWKASYQTSEEITFNVCRHDTKFCLSAGQNGPHECSKSSIRAYRL